MDKSKTLCNKLKYLSLHYPEITIAKFQEEMDSCIKLATELEIASEKRAETTDAPSIPREGKWISNDGLRFYGRLKCSSCGMIYNDKALLEYRISLSGRADKKMSPYCPHCGSHNPVTVYVDETTGEERPYAWGKI